MGFLFLAILIILVVALVVYYNSTLYERRKNEEWLRQQILLSQQKVEAERAKQYARIAGEKARENIDKIASAK